jgi:predicted Zn-dependent protease
VNRRVWAVVAACVISVGAIAALWPRPDEFFEARLRDAAPAAAVALLEAEHRRRPSDAALSARLLTAYERGGHIAPGLRLLAETGRARPLSAPEREAAVRLAYAQGRPDAAVPVLTGPHEPLGAPEREALVRLALAANRPALALTHQAALAAGAPTEARLTRWRELAVAAGDVRQALIAQTRLAAGGGPAALSGLVDLHLGANDPAAALAVAERLVTADQPNADRWHRRAAELAQWAKRPAKAVPHLAALYDRSPTPEAGLALARLLVVTDPARALPFAGRLAAAHPRHAGAFDHWLGQLTRAKRQAEVRAALAERVARFPADAGLHARRVAVLLGMGDRAGAIGELTRWSRRVPHDRATRHRLAVVQVWDGRVAAGWKSYERLLANVSGPMDALETQWRHEWLKVSGSLDDFTEAGRANLRKLAAAKPADAPIWRRLAAAEGEYGDRKQAIAAQRRLVALPAGTGQDALRLAEWLLWDDQVAEGLALLRRLDDRSPLPVEALEDGAERAAQAWRFADAAEFFARIAARDPKRPAAWEALARAKEAAGDLPGAAAAWEKRLALGGGATQRMVTAGLWLRMDQLDKALAAVTGPSPSLAEWRLQAYLAARLDRPAVRERALLAIVEAAPADADARLALVELSARRGDQRASEAHEAALVALRPTDAALLARLAGQRLYGPRPDEAAPYVARLEALPDAGADGWRVIADFYQARDGARAAHALDRLHAAQLGDAETYFRRGELAAAATDGATAQESFAEAARLGGRSAEPGAREAGAYALERLGRPDAAETAWGALAKAHPQRPAAHVALARLRVAAGDLGAASGLLAAAEAIAPDAVEVKVARAEWLKAMGRTGEAAEAFAAARALAPGAHYLAAAEAMARQANGDYGRARGVLKTALAGAPSDVGLVEAHRLVRDRGASQAAARAFFERTGNLERTRLGLTSEQRLGDRWRLTADAAQLGWAGGTLQARELALGARWGAEALEAAAHLAVQAPMASPLAGARVAAVRGAWRAEAGLEEARWDETDELARRNGRERKAGVAIGYSADPRLALRVAAGVGQLTADGLESGLSADGLLEAQARPGSDSPWVVAYQLRHRHWGSLGTSVGLAENLTMQSVLAGFDGRWGPLRLDLRPGVAHDVRTGTVGPLVGGSIGLDLGADGELAASAFWAGQGLTTGVAGDYRQVGLTGTWWF